MGGELTYQPKWDPKTVLKHGQLSFSHVHSWVFSAWSFLAVVWVRIFLHNFDCPNLELHSNFPCCHDSSPVLKEPLSFRPPTSTFFGGKPRGQIKVEIAGFGRLGNRGLWVGARVLVPRSLAFSGHLRPRREVERQPAVSERRGIPRPAATAQLFGAPRIAAHAVLSQAPFICFADRVALCCFLERQGSPFPSSEPDDSQHSLL